MIYDGSGFDEMVTAVPKSDELSLEYLRMLIRGPFRSMSDLIKIDRIKNNYYLHIMELGKWPANVLMNFCIASRIPIEFGYLLSPWAKRCEAGFDPTLAFLLTYSYGCKNTLYGVADEQFDYRSFSVARSGHMWLDPASKWMNILTGMPEKVSKPFKTHPGDSRPTNLIWGHCNDHQQLREMTDEQIADFYTQPLVVLEPLPEPPPPKKAKQHNYILPNFNYAPPQGLVNLAVPQPDLAAYQQANGNWVIADNHPDVAMPGWAAPQPAHPLDAVPDDEGELVNAEEEDFWDEHN